MRINEISPAVTTGLGDLKLRERPASRQVVNDSRTGADTVTGQPLERQYTVDELTRAVDQLNKTMQLYTTELHFEIHEASGEIMVRVMNRETDTVVREIPPEEVLDMVAYFKKMLGIIVDKMI